jgi:class 3 adenylate cyclase
VGRIGDDLRMDYTAQGHTVGLAQRMEQLAAADSAYLSAHTARLVEGYFTQRDLGEVNVKKVLPPTTLKTSLAAPPESSRRYSRRAYLDA